MWTDCSVPNSFFTLPGYLGVSSPLRPLTCNDTPQVAIRCLLCAFMGRLVGPHLDVFEPGVSRSSSWSSPFDFSFHRHCQNIVLSFNVTIVSAFPLFNFLKKLSFSTESTQNLLICNPVSPKNITHSSQTPHFRGFYLVLKNLGKRPSLWAVCKYWEYVAVQDF